MSEEYLWVEKYRPRTIDSCVLSVDLRRYFKGILKKKEIQNMLLSGSAGTGKTTVARALCEELNTDYIVINGSEESGIDVLRTKIKQFASTVSFTGNTKIVILDEADYLNPNSTQPALRGFIEEYSSLHSRCSVVDFKIPKQEKPKIAASFFEHILKILNNENVKFVDKVVAKVVEKHFPDYRRTLNELQRYAQSGVIDEGILTSVSDMNATELIESILDKDWKRMRLWVVNNLDNDPQHLFRFVFDTLMPLTNQVPQLVLTVADYQYKSAFVSDQEINLVACLTELMASVTINDRKV